MSETKHTPQMKLHHPASYVPDSGDSLQPELKRLREQNAALVEALESVTSGDHGICRFDHLNPCWDNRPSDVAGKHWGVGDACPACAARAAIAKAKGG